jgi:hypothetical protein
MHGKVEKKRDDERGASSICWEWGRNGIGIRVMWLELEAADKYQQMRRSRLRMRRGFGKEYAPSKVIMLHSIYTLIL